MSETEVIPMSANIFHAKGDYQTRAVIALDIALACATKMGASEAIEKLVPIRDAFMPAGYDVRGELASALCGDDTAAPKDGQDGKSNLFVLLQEDPSRLVRVRILADRTLAAARAHDEGGIVLEVAQEL